jgi:5-methylcytosine-specific restriction protein A
MFEPHPSGSISPTRAEVRPPASARGYDRTWRRLRLMMLREHPLCTRCGRAASLIDHVMPIEDGGARLDPANLQALCRDCHARKTHEDMQRRKAKA